MLWWIVWKVVFCVILYEVISSNSKFQQSCVSFFLCFIYTKSFGIVSSNRNIRKVFPLKIGSWFNLLIIILFLLIYRRLECPTASHKAVFICQLAIIYRKNIWILLDKRVAAFSWVESLACWQLFDHVLFSWSNGLTLCLPQRSTNTSRSFLRLFSPTYWVKHICCVFPTLTHIPENMCVCGCLCICRHLISVYNKWKIMPFPKQHLHKNAFLEFSGKINNLMPRFPNFQFSVRNAENMILSAESRWLRWQSLLCTPVCPWQFYSCINQTFLKD